jgi:hypothetical protein
MPHVWDYDEEELKKTEKGRIFLLERMINYGLKPGEKIPLKEVEKHWDTLKDRIHFRKRQLLELLIWHEIKTHSTTSRPSNVPFLPL